MVELKELLLLYITVTGFVSYLPQIIKMIKRKSSDDVSIGTWVIWAINSSIYLLYLILSSENIWLVLSQSLEVLLVFATLITIIAVRLLKRR